MNIPSTLAERLDAATNIAESGIISKRTLAAALDAEAHARNAPPTAFGVRTSARCFRANVRETAAIFGFLRCVHCRRLIHLSELRNETCQHLLDCANDRVLGALVIHLLLNPRRIRAAIRMHAEYRRRAEKFGRSRTPR